MVAEIVTVRIYVPLAAVGLTMTTPERDQGRHRTQS